MIWKKFSALGSEVIVMAVLSEERVGLLEAAEKSVAEFERNFSRFLAGSELDRLNNDLGKIFPASAMLIDLVKESKIAYALTGGIFDPTVIGSLEAVGYDRRFDDLREEDGNRGPAPEEITEKFLSRRRFDQLEIRGGAIVRPPGLRLDFGGLGKGYIADWLSENPFFSVSDFWISAGGDLAVRGGEAAGEGWKIGVQDPADPAKEKLRIRTRGQKCGIATSGVFKRKGKKGDFAWHHLIDPRTGLPVENDVLAVTAIASNAKRADIFAKTALILGEKEGLAFIERQADAAALVFLKDGRLSLSSRTFDFIEI